MAKKTRPTYDQGLADGMRALDPISMNKSYLSGYHAGQAARQSQTSREVQQRLREVQAGIGRITLVPKLARDKKKQLKIYDIDARIVSGITDEDVWVGNFELPASSLKAARSLALDLLHDSTYYDPRIDPRAVFDRVEHIGEVEVEAPETSEQATASLIAEARTTIP
jgi:hypothetical protein